MKLFSGSTAGLILILSIGLSACILEEPNPAPNQAVAAHVVTRAGNEVAIGSPDLGGASVAQSFVLAKTGDIQKATVQLQRVGAFVQGAHTLTAKIETDNVGVPSGSVVGTSATLDPARLNTEFANVVFAFPAPVHLTAGQVYWLRIKGSYPVSHTNFMNWAGYDGLDKGYSSGGTYYSAIYETANSHQFSHANIGEHRFLHFMLQE